MDLHFRQVLSWKLSNSLDTEFCLEALEMALSSGRRPQIFHSDQGSQLVSILSRLTPRLNSQMLYPGLDEDVLCS